MMITEYIIEVLKKKLNIEIIMINDDSFEFNVGEAKVRIITEISRIYMDVSLSIPSILGDKSVKRFIKLLETELSFLNINERFIRSVSIDNNKVNYHIEVCASMILESNCYLCKELGIFENLVKVISNIPGWDFSPVEIYVLVIIFTLDNYITIHEYMDDEYSVESEFIS